MATPLAASAPNLKRIGQVYKAKAPGNFTFASHSAMFVGFTPGVLNQRRINPGSGRSSRSLAGDISKGAEFVTIKGKNVVQGPSQIGTPQSEPELRMV